MTRHGNGQWADEPDMAQASDGLSPCGDACQHQLTLGTARTTNTLSAGSSTLSAAHLSNSLPLAVVSYAIATRLLKGVVPGRLPNRKMGLLAGLRLRWGCRVLA
jgi:hypothetical protein